MKFDYPEDKSFFIKLLGAGSEEEFDLGCSKLFDFREPAAKRAEFNSKRKDLYRLITSQRENRCQLKLLPDCEVDKNLVLDHMIPLSSNELNKKLRNMKAPEGKKVPSQSFGSNHPDNLLLACTKCNNHKKHRIGLIKVLAD